jgi:peptidoglycan/LPS O-acetylase OafA/YrhL
MLYLLFLPNLLLFGFGIIVPYASQSWSVGVEEQFYLIWPLLMKFFKNKLVFFFNNGLFSLFWPKLLRV